MNRKSNPFIDWLGLDSVAPNHFQLLGIDPSVTDRRSIKKAAGATLERLGDRPTNGKDLENWRLVRRQIKVAYQCLSDEARRKEYLDQLVLPELPASPTASDSSKRKQAPEPPDPSDTKTATPSASEPSEIPMAIPMAKVIEEEQEDISATKSTSSSPILVVSKSRRKNRSIPLFTLTILLVLAGGVSYAAFEWVVKPLLEGKTLNLAILQQPAQAPAPSATPPDRSPDPAQQPPRRPPLSKDQPSASPNPSTIEPVQPDTTWANLTQAEFPSELGFLHHIGQASLCMKRREWERMERYFKDAQNFVRDQTTLDIYLEHQTVAEAWRAFWRRVEKNARGMASMKELRINDKVLVIVEAKQDSLVYRVGGNRIENPYQQLPLLIALAICEKASIEPYETIVSDRLVVYSVAAKFNPEYATPARELVKREEQLGHATAAFNAFFEKDIESLYWPQSIKTLTAKEIRQNDLINKTSESEKVMQGVNGLNPTEFRQRMGELKMALLTKPNSENTETSVMLQFGIDSCVSENEPDLLTEFLNIKRLRTQAGGEAPDYLAHYQKMSNRQLDEKTVKRLFVCIMELHRKAKLAENGLPPAKILAMAEQVAKKHGLSEEAAWLERNYGEIPSRKNGNLGL